MSKRVLPDGSVEGETFSKNYQGDYPEIKDGDTYGDYHKRVNEAKANGFHLGDLSWSDWGIYCKGSGCHEDVSPYDEI